MEMTQRANVRRTAYQTGRATSGKEYTPVTKQHTFAESQANTESELYLITEQAMFTASIQP